MDALLPDDLLGAILARAGFREGRSTSAVSRRWRRVFFSEPSLWKQGLFVNVRGLSEPALLPAWRGSRAAVQRRSLVRLLQRAAPVLPSLALIDRTVGESPLPAWLPHILHALEPSQLHRLSLHRIQLTHAALGPLLGLSQLAELHLSCTGRQALSPDVLAALGQLASLASFSLAAEHLPARLPAMLWERPATVWGGDAVPLALPLIRRLPHLELLSLYAPRIQLPDGSVCRFDTGARLRLGEERRHHILFERSPTATCSSRDQPPLACGEPPSAGSASEVHLSSLQVTGAELLELPAGTWAAGALPALAAATRLRRINLAANPGLLASRQTAEVLAALPRLSALRLAPATTLQGGAPKSSRPPSALVDELRRRRPCLELLCQLATAEELDSIFFYPVWHS
ncbi:hypothetical protein ABPG75_012321 [Micractinium tetrahymenae]